LNPDLVQFAVWSEKLKVDQGKISKGERMLRRMTIRLTVFLIGASILGGSLVWAAEGIISKVADPAGTICHLKFPAIREETLYWDRPVLKDPRDGDIIDLYGPCDYDPLGKDRWRVKGLSINTSCANSVVETEEACGGLVGRE
jgi:hypothetical protein